MWGFYDTHNHLKESFDARNRERVCLFGGDNEGHPSHID